MFNPYREWLGIPENQLPANYYRLLGLETFESDVSAISNAADRVMLYVRTFQSGRRSAESQKLLNELSAARVCLLNAQSKAQYDAQLRAEMGPAPTASAPIAMGTPVGTPMGRAVGTPVGRAAGIPSGHPAGPSGNQAPIQTEFTQFQKNASFTSKKRSRKEKEKSQTGMLIAIAGGIAAVLCFFVLFSGGSSQPQPVNDQPQSENEQAGSLTQATASIPQNAQEPETKAEEKPVTQTEILSETAPQTEIPTETESAKTKISSKARTEKVKRAKPVAEAANSEMREIPNLPKDFPRFLVSGSNDGEIRFWNPRQGTCEFTFEGKQKQLIRRVKFSPDGKFVVTAGKDPLVRVWDPKTGELLQTLEKHRQQVNDLAFTRDGKKLLTVSLDQAFGIWNTETWELLDSFRISGRTPWVGDWSPDGTRFVAGYADGGIVLWDAESGEKLLEFKGHSNSVETIRFSPDGTRFISSASDQLLRSWDPETGEMLESAPMPGCVKQIDFSSDGQKLIYCGRFPKVFVVKSDSLRTVLLEFDALGQPNETVLFSPDDHFAVLTCQNGVIRIFDLKTGQSCAEFHGHSSSVWSADLGNSD